MSPEEPPITQSAKLPDPDPIIKALKREKVLSDLLTKLNSNKIPVTLIFPELKKIEEFGTIKALKKGLMIMAKELVLQELKKTQDQIMRRDAKK